MPCQHHGTSRIQLRHSHVSMGRRRCVAAAQPTPVAAVSRRTHSLAGWPPRLRPLLPATVTMRSSRARVCRVSYSPPRTSHKLSGMNATRGVAARCATPVFRSTAPVRSRATGLCRSGRQKSPHWWQATGCSGSGGRGSMEATTRSGAAAASRGMGGRGRGRNHGGRAAPVKVCHGAAGPLGLREATSLGLPRRHRAAHPEGCR